MKNYYININNEKIEIVDNKKIDLSKKNIKEIHITSLNKCKKLNLHNNCLTKFNAYLPNIEYLSLYNNNLITFNTNLPKIKELYLHNNNLKSFNTNLPNIIILSLDNNNFSYKRFNNKSTFYI